MTVARHVAAGRRRRRGRRSRPRAGQSRRAGCNAESCGVAGGTSVDALRPRGSPTSRCPGSRGTSRRSTLTARARRRGVDAPPGSTRPDGPSACWRRSGDATANIPAVASTPASTALRSFMAVPPVVCTVPYAPGAHLHTSITSCPGAARGVRSAGRRRRRRARPAGGSVRRRSATRRRPPRRWCSSSRPWRPAPRPADGTRRARPAAAASVVGRRRWRPHRRASGAAARCRPSRRVRRRGSTARDRRRRTNRRGASADRPRARERVGERGADVVPLADSVVEPPRARADATEVEPQAVDAHYAGECREELGHDERAHRATVLRMRVAEHDLGVRRVGGRELAVDVLAVVGDQRHPLDHERRA